MMNPMEKPTFQGPLAEKRGLCGAFSRRTGLGCKNPAGFRTPYTVGKCYLHGGLTPIRHGLFSKRLKDTAAKKTFQKLLIDENCDDLSGELALLRLTVAELQQAVPTLNPEQTLQKCLAVASMVEKISNVAMKLVNIRALKSRMLSEEDITRFLQGVAGAVKNNIADPAVIERIEAELRSHASRLMDGTHPPVPQLPAPGNEMAS